LQIDEHHVGAAAGQFGRGVPGDGE
jgi:hypothetical protein